jgi:hypothetical protein
MEIWIVLIFGLIVVVISFVFASKDYKKNVKKMKDAIPSRDSFRKTREIEDKIALFYFATDDERQEVFCYSKSSKVRFKYNNIVEIEMLIDGDTTVSKKSASIGGAIAGGVLAGSIGAVMGGSAMGKTISKREVSSIKIHILLRNCKCDVFDIECLPFKVKTDSSTYQESYRKAQRIFDTLKLAIDKVRTDVDVLQQASSDIEELKELAALKTQGLITEEEFATMKAKIINR